jgi:hypothetical protein
MLELLHAMDAVHEKKEEAKDLLKRFLQSNMGGVPDRRYVGPFEAKGLTSLI